VALQVEAARRSAAGVDVVLRATNSESVAADVRDGSADVGFVEGPRAPRGVRSRSIGRDRLVIVVPPDHRWARRGQRQPRPVTAAELARTPLVTREKGSGTRDALDTALRNALGPAATIVAPAMALSTSAAVRAAVLAGAGPAVLSELAVADDLSAGRLCAIASTGLALERTLRAIWMGGATAPAGAVRDLVALATARVSTPAG
jgi:DNA-binding transcriptional LysR family regulator